jgi:hypothetical protein
MLRWGMILLFVPSVVLVTLYMLEAQNAVRCVQDSGSWDYVLGVCDSANTHNVVPYMVRHGLWVNLGMLISIVGLCMTTWGMIIRGMGTAKDVE